jgi:hypothetical protein
MHSHLSPPEEGYIELGFAPEQCLVCGVKGKVFSQIASAMTREMPSKQAFSCF